GHAEHQAQLQHRPRVDALDHQAGAPRPAPRPSQCRRGRTPLGAQADRLHLAWPLLCVRLLQVVRALVGVGNRRAVEHALGRRPVHGRYLPSVRRDVAGVISGRPTIPGNPLPRGSTGPVARGPVTAGRCLRLVGGSSSAGILRACHASPLVASVASAGSPCPLGSSALRATASSVVPSSRFINRTPLVCLPALRTCLAAVRMTPPLDVMANNSSSASTISAATSFPRRSSYCNVSTPL